MVGNCTPRPAHFSDEDLTSVALDLLGLPESDWALLCRKWWEWAMVMKAARDYGMLSRDKSAIGIASGHETPVFELSRRMRMIIATDLYGGTQFSGDEADPAMLKDPTSFYSKDFDRARLVVANMDARALAFGDESFDFAFSCSSIEHFGSGEEIVRSMKEAYRVLRPGGVYAFSVDYLYSQPLPIPRQRRKGMLGEFLTRREITKYLIDATPFELDAPIDFEVRDAPFNVFDLDTWTPSPETDGFFPHLWLHSGKSLVTSLFIALVKR